MLKDNLRKVLTSKIPAKILVNTLKRNPVENWSDRLSNWFGVNSPNSVIPFPQPTTACTSNIKIILKLLNISLPIAGNIAECGVFRGSSLIPMGVFAKQNNSSKKLFGLDSFEGFDSTIEKDLELGGMGDSEKRLGGFSNTSYDLVFNKVKQFGLTDTTTLIKGYFQNTLHQIDEQKFSFVHLDCDIYESYKVCLDFFYPRMTTGGIILFDEYDDPAWIGCTQAIDEFLADKPEKPILIDSDNYLKYYIVKE